MSLANPNILLDTTFINKDIAAGASVYDYTALGNGIVYINFKITNAAGDYIVYAKKQWGGTGTATVFPKATFTFAAGETVIEFPTLALFLKTGDILSIWVDGLAGDTAVNGNIQIVALNPSVFEASADYVLADLHKILGSLLTETVPGYLTAGLKKLFDVATPVFTLASKNQSADNDTKLTAIQTDYARRTGDYAVAGAQMDLVDALKNKVGSSGYDRTTDSLEALGESGSAPTVGQIDTQLSTTHGAGSWVSSGSGSGSVTYPYTITNSVTGLPLADVTVTVFTDVTLLNLIASGDTDAFGTVTFYLDPGTYYFVSKKSGFDFTNPDIEAVV